MSINIQDVELMNFKSYGNYKTKLNVANLGPVLVVGQKGEVDEVKSKKSCGTGKSGLIDSIIWCIFGRTFKKAKPGDSVVNWYTGKNCYVTIRTTDGWVITRSRKYQGKDDLLFYKESDPDNTVSTNTNAQKEIIRTFKLDYGIFSSSIFLEQAATPILSLPPKERQDILERMLQLHKINFRAEVAKEKLKVEVDSQALLLKEQELIKRDIDRLESELKELEIQRSEFEQQRIDKVVQIDKKILDLKKEQLGIDLPDIAKLKSRWELITKLELEKGKLDSKLMSSKLAINKIEADIYIINTEITKIEENLTGLDVNSIEDSWNKVKVLEQEQKTLKLTIDEAKQEIQKLRYHLSEAKKSIKSWEDKAGTECPSCKQGISDEHTSNLIKPYTDKIFEYEQRIIEQETILTTKSDKLLKVEKALQKIKPIISVEQVKSLISKKETLITRLDNKNSEKAKELNNIISSEQILSKLTESIYSKPQMTIKEAEAIINRYNGLDNIIKDLETSRADLNKEDNPHTKSINRTELSISEIKTKIAELDDKIKKKDILIKHYTYIRKAYYDKNKIKSLILNNLIPILNDRLKYYLEQFGFDEINIKFNNLLQIESDKWGIETCSGGEKQCIDLALMFALFEMNTIQYGRQCNIMILDEVDSRLDPSYIDALTSLIIDDFGKEGPNKPSTILTVSHKNDMFDAFSTKIRVKKVEDMSYAEIEK